MYEHWSNNYQGKRREDTCVVKQSDPCGFAGIYIFIALRSLKLVNAIGNGLLKHPFLDLENDDGDLAALVAQIEESLEELEKPINNTENKIVDAENNKPKLGKVASSTNEDERSNIQNVKQDKEVVNEMKEESYEPRRHIRK